MLTSPRSLGILVEILFHSIRHLETILPSKILNHVKW